MTILEWFQFYEVASVYAKNILACIEFTDKEYEQMRRIGKEYFAL
jgi:hypothetical protein